MYLGIDVGGTHTDAVVMDGRTIAASAKVPTDHHDLLASVRAAMQGLLKPHGGVEPGRITRMNLSTTLSTNAIVEGKTEDVAVVVSGALPRGAVLLSGKRVHRPPGRGDCPS